MNDPEIKNFYNLVKDSSWPEINNYVDFYKLPANIKNECYNLHNFQQRKAEIENIDYWTSITGQVYQYKNLVYVPITKCASSYYTHLFDNMGWKKRRIVDIDLNSAIMFGLMMEPLTRWVKGTTEWVSSFYYDFPHTNNPVPTNVTAIEAYYRNYEKNAAPVNWERLNVDLQSPLLKGIIETIIFGDGHSVPYSSSFGKFINYVNWVPMGVLPSDNDIKISLMNLFKKHNYDINIPLNTPRAWESSPSKLKVETIIKQALESSTERLTHLYKLYSSDLKFFHNLVDTFDPTWQQN